MSSLDAFDFDKLTVLAQTDMPAFEVERSRIIQSYINSLPEHKRGAARRFQLDLDLKRVSLSSIDFLTYCTTKIQNNVDRLNGLCEVARQELLTINEFPV